MKHQYLYKNNGQIQLSNREYQSKEEAYEGLKSLGENIEILEPFIYEIYTEALEVANRTLKSFGFDLK